MMDTASDKPAGDKPAPTHRLVRDRDEIRNTLTALAQSAAREIMIFTPHLDGYLFNSGRFARALASFAARHRHNRARILVEDTEQALRDNDRVIELCRRLSDFIELRRVGEEHLGLREMFVVVDQRSCLYQQDLAKPDTVVHTQNVREALLLARRFNALWDRSDPIPALRTAGL
jgi:hypothetical protein